MFACLHVVLQVHTTYGCLISWSWMQKSRYLTPNEKKMHFDHLPPRELRNPVEPDGCRSVCGLICNWSPLTWCNDYEKYRLKCNFSKLASKLNQWYQIYELHPLSSSDGNNQARRRLKTNAALSDRWMPAWPRLAGSGDSRPAATQAAPTGETAGESRPVAPPCALLPSIRPLISLFPPLPPSSAFLVGRCFISYRLSMMLFRLSPLIYSHSPASSHLSSSSFMKRLEREAVDIRRIRLNTPVLSALLAGHTSVADCL